MNKQGVSFECIKNVVCGSAYSVTERVRRDISKLAKDSDLDEQEMDLAVYEAYGANLVAINTMFDLSIITMMERDFILGRLDVAMKKKFEKGFSLWRVMTEYEEENIRW